MSYKLLFFVSKTKNIIFVSSSVLIVVMIVTICIALLAILPNRGLKGDNRNAKLLTKSLLAKSISGKYFSILVFKTKLVF